ncbi:Helix-turn-helix domain-containing protein [Paenibacillus sp. yr247]|uniref:helix-turn-helix domain-containing protein n=1 Tax=Paenibacillus sp. yr247 TaxID=1761880 RepID=UPI00088B3755|nr:helix-turn-helix domain-containing protein [Paenibacillus sp. yr247]SDO24477.1 Helix-turn-helix domain-containing protein [Paenibacillus sp. yr247]
MSACLPVLLIGGVYYHLSMKSSVNEAAQISDSSLARAKDRLERIFSSVERSSLQLATDPLIKNSFFDGDSNEKILAHLEISKMLQVTKGSNDFIEDIILYDDVSEDILNNEQGFALKKMYKLRSVLDYLMQFEPKDQCLLIRQENMGDSLACVRFLVSNDIQKARGLLITKLNNDLMSKYLEEPIVYSHSQSMLVLDSSNHVLVHAGQYFQNVSSILNEPSITDIIKSEKASNHFFMEDETGVRYFYSYRKTELGRTYISKIAETDISEHKSWIRWVIVITILLFINIGIAVSVFLSLKAYRPIRQLIDLGKKLNKETQFKSRSDSDITFIQDSWIYLNEQAQKINHYMQKWEPTIKEGLYLQLLEHRTHEKALTHMNEHEVSISHEHKAFVVLMVNLENMHKETRFGRTDGSILSFIVKNVMSEILLKQDQMEGEVVINRIGLGTAVISFPHDLTENEMKSKLTDFSSDLVHGFYTYLKLNVCIGVGRIGRCLEDIPGSYREALEALQYRLYEEQSQVIFIQDLDLLKKQASFYYPFYIEEILIDNLENQRIKDAEENLKEYIMAVRSSRSHVIISQCYNMLLGTMTKSLIRKGYSQIFDSNLLFTLQERKTSTEVNDWFIQQVFPYYEKAFEKSTNMNSLVLQVCQHINEHIHEDISLMQCADLAGISQSHLSKLFKKEMGIQFLDYVLELKLKEAQNLLLNTKLSVLEIAEKIGYSERSLIRIFQKYIHMTPSQFRTKHLS